MNQNHRWAKHHPKFPVRSNRVWLNIHLLPVLHHFPPLIRFICSSPPSPSTPLLTHIPQSNTLRYSLMGNSLTPHFLSLTVQKLVLRLILISCLFAFVVYLALMIQDLVHHESIFRGCLHLGITIIPILVLVHHIVRWVACLIHAYLSDLFIFLLFFLLLRLWPSKEWLVRSDFIYSAAEFAIGESKHGSLNSNV
jgi:hypothetical protein